MLCVGIMAGPKRMIPIIPEEQRKMETNR